MRISGGNQKSRVALACVVVAALIVGVPKSATSQAIAQSTGVVEAQLQRAETAWRSGASMLEAKARVDRVLDMHPDHGEALRLRSFINLSMRSVEEAFADAVRAVEALPEDAGAHVAFVEAARLSGRNYRASEALDRALSLLDSSLDYHLRLSWNALQLEHFDHAESLARVALQAHPEEPGPYYQLARVFQATDREGDAVLTLKRGFERRVLSWSAIEGDALLNEYTSHEALQPFRKR